MVVQIEKRPRAKCSQHLGGLTLEGTVPMSEQQTTTAHDELKRAMLAAMGAALAGDEAAKQRYSDRIVELTDRTIAGK